MDVFVHIGMLKTGTTAIQDYLNLNRDALREQGLLMPAVLGRTNQRLLPLVGVGWEPNRSMHRKMFLHTQEDTEALIERGTVRLRKVLRRHTPDQLVLTSEQISSEVRTPEQIARFGQWVREFDPNPTIVVYLRRQDRWLLSRYSTDIRVGETAPFEIPGPEQTGRGSRYDYATMVDRWAAEFGAERVLVRVFERGSLIDQDAATDFFHAIGRPELAGLADQGEPNVSLDIDVIEFLRLFNQFVPKLDEHGRNPMRIGVLEAIDELPRTGHRWQLAPDEARTFVDRFKDGNAHIARTYLGRSDGVLFDDDYPDGQRPGGQLLTAERAVEIAARMWLTEKRTTGAASAPESDESDDSGIREAGADD